MRGTSGSSSVPVRITDRSSVHVDPSTPSRTQPAQSARLGLEAKLFQKSHWPDVSAVAAGESLDAPLVVELDPTSFCDMKCPECISVNLLNQARFTSDRLTTLATEMVEIGVRAVILIGGGEPLMHNAIGDVLTVLGEAGVAIGITTNGTMIHRHQDAIARFSHWTRVSVDAGTAACFERIRPHRSGRNVFDQVIGNMRRLAAAKTGNLGYSFLLVARTNPDGSIRESNFTDVEAAALLARSIGCDYFEVKPTYDLAHFLTEQPDALRAQLAEQVAAAQALAGPGFEVISPRTLEAATNGEDVEPKAYTRCPVAELRTLVTATGAYLCPYHRGNPAARYGDPLRQTMDDLWNGPERRRVASTLSPTDACKFHCVRHQTNLTLLRMSDEDLSGRVGPDYDPFL